MRARVVLRAGLTLGVIGAVAYGLLALSLPRASHGDVLVSRVIRQLDRAGGGGGVGRLDGYRFVASCRRVGRRTDVIQLRSGTRLRLRGVRVLVAHRAHGTRPPLHAVADLAGSYVLYRRQLAARLLSIGADPVPTLVGRTPAYELPLGRHGWNDVLFVDRRTLRPIAALYRASDVRGFSRLVPARHGRGC